MSIKVTRDTSKPMRHVVRIRDHEFSADLLPQGGGEDSGATPHDFYDSALGTCKALTVLWYAKKKGIPVEGIEVTVERDDSGERKGTYRLNTRLALTGTLTDAQKKELLGVAQKCPVHKLMSEVNTEITTVLADAPQA